MPRAEIPEGVEILAPVTDKLPSGHAVTRMHPSPTFGSYLHVSDLPQLHAHWRAQFEEELLGNDAARAAQRASEMSPRTSGIRKTWRLQLQAALDSIPTQKKETSP